MAIIVLIPAVHVLLTSAKGKAASLVQLRPLAEPSKVYDSQGNLLYIFDVADYRVPIPLNGSSLDAQHAVLDAEDSTFYLHGAVDGRAILRAFVSDVTHGHVVQGGSTITQQLVKNSVLTPARNVSRKLREAVLSFRLEQQMTKNQILERYLNTVYFGNGSYGIEAASEIYFGKPAKALTPAEGALLAGLIRNPSGDDPLLHPAAALQRRNEVIDQMVANNHLTAAQAAAARTTELPTHLFPKPGAAPNAFIQQVKLSLESAFFPQLGKTEAERADKLFRGGLTIQSTYDPTMQFYAGLAANQVLPSSVGGQFKPALVSIDPTNGDIKDLLPGNGTDNGNGYDVVTGFGGSSKSPGRPTGSSFKLFVLMAALDEGISPQATIDGTGPCAFTGPFQGKVINNASDGAEGGVMTIQQATANSVNCAFLRLGLRVGLDKVTAMARRLGVKFATIDQVLDESIGVNDILPVEMASAYATVAADGVYHQPTYVSKITDENGNVIYQHDDKGTRVVPAQEARVATSVLQTVITSGTGTAAAIGRPAAGKTGTTDSETDAWFVGYTPQLATAVWVGDPGGEVPMRDVGGVTVFGGTYPAKIFAAYMRAALATAPALDFPPFDPYLLGSTQYIQAPFSIAAPGPSSFPSFPIGPRFRYSPGPGSPPSPTPATTVPSTPPPTAPPTTAQGPRNR